MKKHVIRSAVRSAARTIIATAILVIGAGTASQAAPILLAVGSLSGSLTDLSTQTAGPLENGVAGNLLGGLGSGIAYAGGNTFIATPDRGPNAVSYNSAVDDTASYINRFQTFDMSLTLNVGAGLPFVLTPTLTQTTLLSSATPLTYGSGAGLGLGSGAPALNSVNNTYYFTGRSDNFDPTQNSGNPNNGRLDPESVRVSNDGKSVFISDEYGPYVYQFDRTTGQRIKSFTLPSSLDVANLSPVGNTEINGNTSGRVANKGMEGLALTPDGKTLVGIMQAPLIQDSASNNKIVRIVTIDIATGTTHEYAYQLTTGSGVSEIVAINDHEFLVDERDGKGLGDGSTAAVKQLYKIDLTGAVDVSNLGSSPADQAALLAAKVNKGLFIDLVPTLTAALGISAKNVPAKIEGLAFGQDVDYNGTTLHTLYITNDNDFLATATLNNGQVVNNPNNFYVIGFDDASLPGFQSQQFVPEPATYALLLGSLGLMVMVRRHKKS
jgi:hypothetical protein